MLWQATTVALVGIMFGVPLGIVVGRVVWQAFATNLGAVPVAVVPVDDRSLGHRRPRGRQCAGRHPCRQLSASTVRGPALADAVTAMCAPAQHESEAFDVALLVIGFVASLLLGRCFCVVTRNGHMLGIQAPRHDGEDGVLMSAPHVLVLHMHFWAKDWQAATRVDNGQPQLTSEEQAAYGREYPEILLAPAPSPFRNASNRTSMASDIGPSPPSGCRP